MKYWQRLSNITLSTGNTYRNLFEKYLINNISEDIIENYEIISGESLELISNKLYDNPQYYWILALLNDIKDLIYDLPLTEEDLKVIVTDTINDKINSLDDYSSCKKCLTEYAIKIGSTSLKEYIEDLTDVEIENYINDYVNNGAKNSFYTTLYTEIYEYVFNLNETNRVIKVISPEFLDEIIFDFIEGV